MWAWLIGLACAQVAAAPCAAAEAGEVRDCSLPRWPGRAYTLRVPATWDGQSPLPVIVAFHGGGGRREAARRTTCAGGDEASGTCLDDVARGYAVVTPDGTAGPAGLRTWNAGGGGPMWQCVSGRACRDGVDDVAYVRDLLDDVARVVPVDVGRVFATGLSNGGAMAHRVGCALSDRFAAIAAVGGANQLAEVQGCAPARPVSVLQIHGTADACWAYDGGPAACLQSDGLAKVGARASTLGWVTRLGCDPTPTREDVPDTVADGTTTAIERWTCPGAAVELRTIAGGGHAWPQGHRYLPSAGAVAQDWSGNTAIVAFFDAHPRTTP